ncbi:MAG: DUF1365 domain-containing protein [Vicinamibacterales bacterium]
MTPIPHPGLYVGRILHHRLTTPRHCFRYPLFMWLLDPAAERPTGQAVRGFACNQPGPVSFRTADHLSGRSDTPLVTQLREVVESQGHGWPGGPVRVLTHCRVFGYVFNPVSFWYCYQPDGALRTVVAEVNNTFGERHCYVSCAPVAGGRSSWLAWSDEKVFRVSPFFSTEGQYAFSVEPPADRLRVRIDLRGAEAIRLVTVLALRREPLHRWSVLSTLVRYPFMTLQVIAAIHWEALRLWRKGVRYHVERPHGPNRVGEGTA